MAYEQPGFSFTLPAGQDYSAGAQFRFVDINSSSQAVDPAAGGSAVGVRQTRPKSGEATTIVADGISIVEAGGAVTAGALVATDNVGRVVAATTGNVILGRALEAASASGIQIAVLLYDGNAKA